MSDRETQVKNVDAPEIRLCSDGNWELWQHGEHLGGRYSTFDAALAGLRETLHDRGVKGY